MFLDNKYSQCYFRLVQKAKDRNSIKGNGIYLEEHHIVPRSLGGTNNKSNLVMFTAREHYVAHRLLTKMLIGKSKQKMHMALFCMITKEQYGSLTEARSKHYERVRSDYAKLFSGDNHFNRGVVRSEETKQLIREKRAKQIIPEEAYARQSKTMSSLVWMNDGVRSYRIRPELVEDKLINGLMMGRIIDYAHTEEYRMKRKTSAIRQWQRVKAAGQTNLKGQQS